MSTAKANKKKLFDRPILGPIVVSLIIFWGTVLVGVITGGVVDIVTGRVPVMDPQTLMTNGLFYLYFCVIAGFLACLIFKGRYHGAFKGCFSAELGDKQVKTSLIALLAVELLVSIPTLIIQGAGPFTLQLLGTALMAGVCEEAAFRVGLISLAMRNSGPEKAISRSLAISIIVFGLVHSLNATQGQSAANTILQILNAFALGFLFAVFYLKTGNALIVMALHTLHDILALLQAGAVQNGIMVSSASAMDLILEAFFVVVCVVLGIYMLRGSRDEILALWNKKWSRA